MRYAIVIEKANDKYSAYVPDLPGCVAFQSASDSAPFSPQGLIACTSALAGRFRVSFTMAARRRSLSRIPDIDR